MRGERRTRRSVNRGKKRTNTQSSRSKGEIGSDERKTNIKKKEKEDCPASVYDIKGAQERNYDEEEKNNERAGK